MAFDGRAINTEGGKIKKYIKKNLTAIMFGLFAASLTCKQMFRKKELK